MNKVTSNILNGIAERLKHDKNTGISSEINWWQKKILKHQDDVKIKQYSFKQFKVFYKRPYELLHTYQELFDNELYKFHSPHIAPVIIDCGANIGLSVLYFKKIYQHAHIEAFEPDAQNFELLSQNCKINQLKHISLHNDAIWIHNGTISFSANESEASHVSEDANTGNIEVSCVRLKEVLQKYPKVDFLKMDIEGAEWKVVQDTAAELTNVENFFLEYHGKADETYKLNDLITVLRQSGFSVYIKNAADALKHPFLQKKTGTAYDVQLNIFSYRK
jgi:FkbM family methyltransferase